METKTTIDVRPILADGGCPFDNIMETAKTLQQGAAFTVVAPFNPVPIKETLKGYGIDVVSIEQPEDGSFVVTFRFTPLKERKIDQELDLTDLEPPQPMMKIMETMSQAKAGTTGGFTTRFKPIHMLNNLDSEAYLAESEEQPNGHWYNRVLKREVVRCKH